MTASQIVPFSADSAKFIGDERDGVYYQTAKGPDGWHVTAVVDSDTGSFVDTILDDDGPYETEEDAEGVGHDFAVQWCRDNEVHFEEE